MTRWLMAMAIGGLLAVGCNGQTDKRQVEDSPENTGLKIEAPGVDLEVGDNGVHVDAPGTQVDVDKDHVEIDAPDTDVKVD